MTEDARYHYRLITRAIAEIDAADGPLSLPDLAVRLGLSTAHFQRVFTRFVGVSPKRYSHYLALGLAKERLAAQEPLAHAADAAGLSGTGRLHDLFVQWEGMTPGAFATGGAGVTLDWAEVETPYGPALAVAGPRGLAALSFIETAVADTLAALAPRWPAAALRPAGPELAAKVAALLDGRGGLALAPVGGPFQLQVWRALLALPEGGLTTYAEIAETIGTPKAHRAVGTAVGQNPLALLIPCHRVIRKDGALGGYRWGLPRKRAILAREAARSEAARP